MHLQDAHDQRCIMAALADDQATVQARAGRARGQLDDAAAAYQPDKPAAPLDLGDRVTAHMETRYPYTEASGGWKCLLDQRDNTVAIAYTVGSDLLNTAGIRGNVLYQWLCSLRDDGFAVEPRLDMELYGRPNEESPDGRAQWLHVTGWDPGRIVPSRSLAELAQDLRDKLGVISEHRVTLDPDRVPALRDVSGQHRPVTGLCFGYRNGRLQVGADLQGGDAQLVARPPQWVLDIAEEHRGCPAPGWCNPHDVPPPPPERPLL